MIIEGEGEIVYLRRGNTNGNGICSEEGNKVWLVRAFGYHGVVVCRSGSGELLESDASGTTAAADGRLWTVTGDKVSSIGRSS